jgi:hypothetical protein
MLGSMNLWAENTANFGAENPQAYSSHSAVNRALGVSQKKLQVIFLFKLLPWAISEALAFRNREPIITGSYV